MEKNILLSPHNPATGARHIGHYFGSMRDLKSLQDENEIIIVVDDLLAYYMYPKERKELQNRTFCVVQDFMNCGLDLSITQIILTSQLPNLGQALIHLSTMLDMHYLTSLYASSFLGSLHTYQRIELGLPKYSSLNEIIYPQLGIPGITIALNADIIHGGEEIIGYSYIIEDIHKTSTISTNLGFKKASYMPSANGFVLGRDGTYMIQKNSVLVSEPADSLKKLLLSEENNAILLNWMASKSPDSNNTKLMVERETFIDEFINELSPFRNERRNNGEIMELINKGTEFATDKLDQFILKFDDEFQIF